MKLQPSVYRFSIILMLIFAIACKDSNKETEDVDTEDTTQTPVYSKSAIDEADPTVWIYDYDKDIPKKNREIKELDSSPQEWIDFINSQNKEVALSYVKQTGDTLFVAIKESTFLTQQMGSAGADAYMSVATYTLTEPENVNYVHFDFIEGDHARPGIYSRQYYIDRNKTRFQ